MAGPIRISVLANASQARRELDSTGRAATGMGDKFARAGRALAIGAGAGLAVAAVGIAKLGVASTEAASQAEQSLGATETVFGRYADNIIKASDKAALSVGLSANEYRESANLIGSLFRNQGVATDQLAGKTDRMVTLGADLAATFGGPTSEAVAALGSAFKGEFDPLERYGISLKASTISTEALAVANVKSATEFSALSTAQQTQAKQQATTNLLLEQSTRATGAFSRESNTLAGQQQRLGAQSENLQATLGKALTPALTTLAGVANDDVLPPLQDLAEKYAPRLGAALGDLAESAGPRLEAALTNLPNLLGQFADSDAADSFGSIATSISDLAPVAKAVLPVLNDGLKVTGTVLKVAADNSDLLAAALPILAAGYVTLKAATLVSNAAKGAELIANRLLIGSSATTVGAHRAEAAALGTLTGAQRTATAASGAQVRSVSRLGLVARGAAGIGGMGALAAGASSSNDAVSTLANVGGGAMLGFSIGGPIGAAIGGAGGLLLTLAQNAGKSGQAFRESIPPAENFAATLDQVTGAATAQTRAQVLLAAQQSGVLGLTTRLGVNTRDLIGSVLGQRGATTRLTAAYRENSEALDGSEQVKLNEFLRTNTRGFQVQADVVRQNARDTQTWAQALRGLPPEAKTEVKAIGSEATAAQIRNLRRDYDLTPRQVRTVINAIGTEQTVRKVRGVYRVIEDGKRVRADLDPFVDNFTSSLRTAEQVARRGRGRINNDLGRTGRVPADLDPFEASMLRGLGNVSRSSNRSISGTSRMLTGKTTSTKANLNPFLTTFGQGMDRARDVAQRGGEAARTAAERGPANARADLGNLNSSLAVGLDRTQDIASSGGNQVGSALKQGIEGGLAGLATNLINSAAGAVRAAINAAKAEGEINSPSKAMEWVGEMLGLGLPIGLDRHRARAERSGRDLSRSALGGAERGLADVERTLARLRLTADQTSARSSAREAYNSAAYAASQAPPVQVLRLTADVMDQLSRGRAYDTDISAWRAVGGGGRR